DGEHLLRYPVDGHDAGLVDDDAAALDHDQRVGRAEVDAYVVGEQPQKGADRVEGHRNSCFTVLDAGEGPKHYRKGCRGRLRKGQGACAGVSTLTEAAGGRKRRITAASKIAMRVCGSDMRSG